MKKTFLICILLLLPMAGFAQESRQDVSLSADSFSMPQTNGNGVQQTATITGGALVSYRFMLTPRSALEGNYSFAQDSQRYYTSSLANGRVYTRTSEMTGAYVLNFNLKRYNPFVEAGFGILQFSPLAQAGTNQLDARRSSNIAALAGAGLAYELSPSWDIRFEAREFLTKSPYFGITTFKTNSYTIINMPTLGIAYHF
jgi:opacity protein-like surface antigen